MRSTSLTHHRLHLPYFHLLALALASTIFAAALATDHHNLYTTATPTLQRHNARFYNALVDDSAPHSANSRPNRSSSSSSKRGPELSVSASATTEVTPTPGETIDCQQPLASFLITHAAILACPLCGSRVDGDGGGDNGAGNGNGSGSLGGVRGNGGTTSQSNQTGQGSLANRPTEKGGGGGRGGGAAAATPHAAGTVENMTVTIQNPAKIRPDIHCRLSWDTAAASPGKFPIAKQMDCDRDDQNQLNVVLEKQASGVAAGFFLFVWNNNQMETIAAWRVPNITTSNDGGAGWSNGTGEDGQRWYFNGAALLSSMPAMSLFDFVNGIRPPLVSGSADDP